jgi:hypothetical protein
MDVDRIIAAARTGAVEVLGGITKGPSNSSFQGALNVAILGARDNEETIGSGVETPQRHRNGLCPRRTIIVVSTFYSSAKVGIS